MGDDNAITKLRAQGFKVAVDHQVNPPGSLAPFTYDSGYHTVVEHYNIWTVLPNCIRPGIDRHLWLIVEKAECQRRF